MTLVRVGSGGNASNNVFGAVSSDGGKNWASFADQAGSSPGRRHGGDLCRRRHHCVVAVGRRAGGLHRPRRHWHTLAYPSANGMASLPVGAQVLSDGINGNLFYAWNPATGTFFSSSDKGVSWYASTTSGLPMVPSWQTSQAVAVIGVQGDVWLATPSGLYRSQSSGWSWSRWMRPQ